jgi:hypothetical protein
MIDQFEAASNKSNIWWEDFRRFELLADFARGQRAIMSHVIVILVALVAVLAFVTFVASSIPGPGPVLAGLHQKHPRPSARTTITEHRTGKAPVG